MQIGFIQKFCRNLLAFHLNRKKISYCTHKYFATISYQLTTHTCILCLSEM